MAASFVCAQQYKIYLYHKQKVKQSLEVLCMVSQVEFSDRCPKVLSMQANARRQLCVSLSFIKNYEEYFAHLPVEQGYRVISRSRLYEILRNGESNPNFKHYVHRAAKWVTS